jgi:hypothetical protein
MLLTKDNRIKYMAVNLSTGKIKVPGSLALSPLTLPNPVLEFLLLSNTNNL